MRRIFCGLLVLALVGGNAFAWDFHFDGVFTDGSSPFDHNNNWAPYDYPYGIGNLPSPGTLSEGGEKFDLEGLQVREQGEYIYVALANSFGYNVTSTSWGENYDLGDLFIGVDGVQNKFAIDIQYAASGAVGTADFYMINDASGVDGIPDMAGGYHDYSAIRNAVGAYELDLAGNVVNTGSVDFALNGQAGYETGYLEPGHGDTYVWEFRMHRSLLGDYTNLDFHVALECGNDFMDTRYSAVPEPATLVLLGLGLAGAGLTRRLRRRR